MKYIILIMIFISNSALASRYEPEDGSILNILMLPVWGAFIYGFVRIVDFIEDLYEKASNKVKIKYFGIIVFSVYLLIMLAIIRVTK